MQRGLSERDDERGGWRSCGGLRLEEELKRPSDVTGYVRSYTHSLSFSEPLFLLYSFNFHKHRE